MKMENIVFDRNYEIEEAKKSEKDAAIFEQVYAPGGFMDKLVQKLDAIPKVIVPEDEKNYEYLLKRCDAFAQKHHGRIHGVIDYERWDAHIDLYLPLLEFDDEEDMSLLKDIGEKAHYFCASLQENGDFHVHIMINYFQELMSDEYGDYLKYKTLLECDELAAMFGEPKESELSPEEEAVTQLIKDILDRFENETSVDRTTAFRAVLDHMAKDENAEPSLEQIAVLLTALLEKVIEEEKNGGLN